MKGRASRKENKKIVFIKPVHFGKILTLLTTIFVKVVGFLQFSTLFTSSLNPKNTKLADS